MLLMALPALLAGALVAVLSQRALLADSAARVFYPGVMLYNYAAVTLATTILLLALILLAFWVPQALRRAPRFLLNGAAVALALAATALACWGSVPQLVVTYRHVDRAALNGHQYQLGVRYAADGDNAYVLCECDGLGLVCRCRRLAEAGQPVFKERPALLADPAAGTLSIQVGQETLYRFSP